MISPLNPRMIYLHASISKGSNQKGTMRELKAEGSQMINYINFQRMNPAQGNIKKG